MQVYLGDGSAQTIVRAATLRQKLPNKLAISRSHSILTSGQPVPELTLRGQAPGWVATGVHWYDTTGEKIPTRMQARFEPRCADLEADALTTGPTRRYGTSTPHRRVLG